jgi:TolB-like protein
MRYLVVLFIAVFAWGCATIDRDRPRGASRKFDYDLPTIYDAAKATLSGLGLQLVEESHDHSFMLAERNISLWSYGELVGIYFSSDRLGQTEVTVKNKRKLATNITAADYTKQILDGIPRHINRASPNTAVSTPVLEKETSSPPVIPLPPREWSRENIAVANLDAVGIPADEAVVLSENLRTALVDTDYFNVVSKADMQRILSEQKFQRSDYSDTQSLVEMGRILSIAYMVGGSIGQVGSTYNVTMRLVDVETAKIQITLFEDVKADRDTLLITIRSMGRKLAKKYQEGRASAPSAKPESKAIGSELK